MGTKGIYFLVLLTILTHLSTSCNEEFYDVEKEDKALAYIRKSYSSGLYDQAIEKAREFKARYPYAHSSVDIDLVIADSYFNKGEYLEASIHYTRFTQLYPKHPKKPYAMFQIGNAFWQEAPSAADREQSPTQKALEKWKLLTEQHPESDYATKAKKMMKEGEERIINSMLLIANFYDKQGIWHACATWALDLITNYPERNGYRKEALMLASKAFQQLSQDKEKLLKNNDKDPLEKNVYFKKFTVEELKKKSEDFKTEASKI